MIFLGFFAAYCGFIYNEFFAMKMPFWHSCYTRGIREDQGNRPIFIQEDECVYPFGIDWGWKITNGDELKFLNSYKMKMSIILGVIQMTFGMILKGINAIYFKD